MSTSAARLLSPEEIAMRAGEQPSFLHAPEPDLFAQRSLRLRELGAGHALRDYLLFLADVAQAQHELFQAPAALTLPTAKRIDAAARAGRPLLDTADWSRDPAWRAAIRQLMDLLAKRMAKQMASGAARETVLRLASASDDWLEAQAQRILGGMTLDLDLAGAPLVAAGLQLYWTRLVAQTQARFDAEGPGRANALTPFGRIADPTVCPCCGSRPVASITRVGAQGSGVRYLSCGLCSMQWHYVRVKCSRCQGTKGISFQSLVAQDGIAASEAVQAECCEFCGHYLKIVHMEKDLHVEPVADDLASLTLDLLVSDTGLQRQGVNLLLWFGDSQAANPAPPPDPGGV
ncbi:MAG: formate dehydrogenase accessory protein FdhE [Burkholderiaceae bacterium]|nr:formate dehydrogenase accessory protein FdhE [Burkholderiaceae bacterium]